MGEFGLFICYLGGFPFGGEAFDEVLAKNTVCFLATIGFRFRLSQRMN